MRRVTQGREDKFAAELPEDIKKFVQNDLKHEDARHADFQPAALRDDAKEVVAWVTKLGRGKKTRLRGEKREKDQNLEKDD